MSTILEGDALNDRDAAAVVWAFEANEVRAELATLIDELRNADPGFFGDVVEALDRAKGILRQGVEHVSNAVASPCVSIAVFALDRFVDIPFVPFV